MDHNPQQQQHHHEPLQHQQPEQQEIEELDQEEDNALLQLAPVPPPPRGTLLNIPHDVLVNHLFPYLPAAGIFAAFHLRGNWAEAFNLLVSDPARIAASQAAHGGTMVIDHLLETSQLTNLSRVGLRRLPVPNLDGSFPDRSPRIVAAHAGVLLILVRHPDELVIWNPVGNQQIFVGFPHGVGRIYQSLGWMSMIVEFLDEPPHTRITLACPSYFTRDPAGDYLFNVVKWSTDYRVWNHVEIIAVESYDPRSGTVNVGLSAFCQLSFDTVGWFTVGQGNHDDDAGVFPGPLLNDPDQTMICNLEGRLGFLVLYEDRISVFTRVGGEWVARNDILLAPLVVQHRHIFGSRGITTRRGPAAEDTDRVLVDMQMVSMTNRVLILFVRSRWISWDFTRRTVRILQLGPPPPPLLGPRDMRFFPYSSSLILLPDD